MAAEWGLVQFKPFTNLLDQYLLLTLIMLYGLIKFSEQRIKMLCKNVETQFLCWRELEMFAIYHWVFDDSYIDLVGLCYGNKDNC